MPEWILTNIIIIIASLVQGAVGFGFSLIAVPLMVFLLPIQQVVPMIVSYSLLINIMVFITTVKKTDFKKIRTMILGGFLGIPIGIFGLQYVEPNVLKIVIGIIILVTTLFMWRGYKVHFKKEGLSYGVTGFLSGILNGGLSMSGPPIVMFLSNQGCDKDEFRGNLALYAMVTNVITIAMFTFNGMFTGEVVSELKVNLVVLVLGSYLGIKASKFIGEKQFRKVVLILLMLIGAVTIVNSIKGL